DAHRPLETRKPGSRSGFGLRGVRRTVSQVTGYADDLRNVLLEPVGRYHSAMYRANQVSVPARDALRDTVPGTPGPPGDTEGRPIARDGLCADEPLYGIEP